MPSGFRDGGKLDTRYHERRVRREMLEEVEIFICDFYDSSKARDSDYDHFVFWKTPPVDLLLHFCCLSKQLDMVQLIIESGLCNPLATNSYAFYLALTDGPNENEKRSTEIGKYLCDVTDGKILSTPTPRKVLPLAAYLPFPYIRRLLDTGLFTYDTLRCRVDMCMTYAAEAGNVETVVMLVEMYRGWELDVNSIGGVGTGKAYWSEIFEKYRVRNAFLRAVGERHLDVMKALLQLFGEDYFAGVVESHGNTHILLASIIGLNDIPAALTAPLREVRKAHGKRMEFLKHVWKYFDQDARAYVVGKILSDANRKDVGSQKRLLLFDIMKGLLTFTRSLQRLQQRWETKAKEVKAYCVVDEIQCVRKRVGGVCDDCDMISGSGDEDNDDGGDENDIAVDGDDEDVGGSDNVNNDDDNGNGDDVVGVVVDENDGNSGYLSDAMSE
ncbi:hypothetical protein HDU76_011758 [Blyttiomyces sp. JEL0837]|nr:hypothetical protein HDU76_011758 [Blyttiomyces sp. JEL0837]